MSRKERLDVLLVEQGFFPTREKARRFVMTGNVLVDDVPQDKPGTKVERTAQLRLRGETPRYVGRGGLKLEKALQLFPVPIQDAIVVDIGASTGGFTDCALQHGAAKVYAIDVGYGQLAWKLQTSPQVVNMERTNIRHVTPEMLAEPADLVVTDVSFISVLKVLPPALPLLQPNGQLIILIKPQFEAGKDAVGKGGIVREPTVHRRVLREVLGAAEAMGLHVCGLDRSPIRGMTGNIEFLAWLTKNAPKRPFPWQEALITLTENNEKE